MKNNFTEREQIIEVVNRLFIYTDYLEWEKLQTEVFAENVILNMESLGAGPATTVTGKAITEMWEEGFSGIDAIHHQAGNYLVDINGGEANVFAYAIATHYKKDAVNGNVREFVGSYDLHLVQTENGWRIDSFKYNVKYLNGNLDLK